VRSIDERHLCFEFGSEWHHVEKWDDCPAYRDGIFGLENLRALDIIALSKTECLLIEIKDHRDKNETEAGEAARQAGKRPKRPKKPKKGRGDRSRGDSLRSADESTQDGELPAHKLVEQVTQKVAGTLSGLVGAARVQRTCFAGDFVSFLASQAKAGRKVRVVLWIEGHLTSKGGARAKPNLGALTLSLKRKVKWLTSSVHVLSTASPQVLRGVTVIDNRP